MTKIVRKEMYCPKCDKNYEVGVLISTSSFMIEKSPILKKQQEEGTLFKNFCPKCGTELVNIKKDNN